MGCSRGTARLRALLGVRGGARCAQFGSLDLTDVVDVDHMQPLALGGEVTDANAAWPSRSLCMRIVPLECQWCPGGSAAARHHERAAIATSGAEKMRLKVTHFFRRATPEQQRAVAQAVDDTAAQLTSPSADAQALAATAWAQLIAQYLAGHRDSMSEVHELAVPTPPASRVWHQHNAGTGTFIGGDVHGGLTFNHGGASDGGR